jgi:soluble lytic murein transglycosylase
VSATFHPARTAPVCAAALVLAACLCAGGAASAQPVAAPGAPSGPGAGTARVIWNRPVRPLPVPRRYAPLAAQLAAAHSPAESLAAWRSAVRDSILRPYVLLRTARLEATLGDTARAEGSWGRLAAERSPWQWEALRARSEILRARGLVSLADSLLEQAERSEWMDSERAEWLARRVELRAALADSAQAATFAAQMIARYPSDPRAPAALRTLEAARSARGDSLTANELVNASAVELAHGRKAEAAARLARAARRGAEPALQLRRARLLRELSRFRDAREATTLALQASRFAEETLAVRIERARILRDQDDVPGALKAFADAARRAPGGGPEARWERARLLEEQGEWTAARNEYARVAEIRRGSDEGSMFRAGLMSLAAGQTATARNWFARGSGEDSRFWCGVMRRKLQDPRGDSLLRALAEIPGYTFYRAAARETLALSGWEGTGARTAPPSREPGLMIAQGLDALGCGDDAAWVMDRWAAGDRRLTALARGAEPAAGDWLAASASAYRGGHTRQAIRFASRAATRAGSGRPGAAPEGGDWQISPWLYPPSYDSLFAAYPDSAGATPIERSLLRAVTWKESRFDPVARSRSDAIGLLQLKRPAVIDVARWLHETPPSDAELADPAVNLRYGARYLERMIVRFDGDLPLALAAYNAGPTVAGRWTRLRTMGGDALACEEIDYPETQDYVKTILAVRQAYRELRPAFAP